MLEAVVEWQNRPLERSYPVVYFDALRIKIRDEGSVRNKAAYLALGIAADGTKDVLRIWIEQNEGAKFWLKVMNELRNRGVEDILIAVVDGLKGFPEAITTVFPLASVQTCILHLTAIVCPFAAGKNARPWRANSKGFTGPKPWRRPPSGSASSKLVPGAKNIR